MSDGWFNSLHCENSRSDIDRSWPGSRAERLDGSRSSHRLDRRCQSRLAEPVIHHPASIERTLQPSWKHAQGARIGRQPRSKTRVGQGSARSCVRRRRGWASASVMPRLAWMMCPATTTRVLRTWSCSPSNSKGEIVPFKDDTGCCHQGDVREALTDQEIGGAFRRGVHGSTFPRLTRVPESSPKDVDSRVWSARTGAPALGQALAVACFRGPGQRINNGVRRAAADRRSPFGCSRVPILMRAGH